MTSTKSGEIFRIGSGNFCFLCIHCGFQSTDLKQILNHIEAHFTDTLNESDVELEFEDSKIFCDFNNAGSEDESKFIFAETLEIKVEESDDQATYPQEDIKVCMDEVQAKKQSNSKNSISQGNEKYSQSSKPHQCPICEKNCENFTKYKRHLKLRHQMYGKLFQCYICRSFVENRKMLRKHISAVHLYSNCYQCASSPPITNGTDSRPHKCFFCKSWYQNHVLFQRHFKDKHSDENFFDYDYKCNEFACYVCRKEFITKGHLKAHSKVHVPSKSFVCEVCGNSYKTSQMLMRHLKGHQGKLHVCAECGKTFNHYARLYAHKYSHRTELNYVCTVCKKAFKTQRYLTRHMTVHRGEKEFQCRYCDKRFTFSTSRRAHEKTLHHAQPSSYL